MNAPALPQIRKAHGILNLFEYLLAGHSPQVAGRGPKISLVGGTGRGFHEFLLERRAGTQTNWCWIEMSETLGGGTWQPAQSRGCDILVDSPAAGQTRVRVNKNLPHAFLRLATPVN